MEPLFPRDIPGVKHRVHADLDQILRGGSGGVRSMQGCVKGLRNHSHPHRQRRALRRLSVGSDCGDV